MRGIELVLDRTTTAPAREQAALVVNQCLRRGLIVLTAGTYGNVIRLLVPLVITDDQFTEGLGILEEALRVVPCAHEPLEPVICLLKKARRGQRAVRMMMRYP